MGNCLLREIKLFDVQDMLDDLRNKGFKHNSVKYVYRTLHAALNYAIKCELLERNVCGGAEVKEDEKKFEASVYSVNDLNKLLMLLREQEHPIYAPVLLASMRGLRRGECLGLQWDDIDFNSNVGHIKNNYVVVKGVKHLKKVKIKGIRKND